ncbi:hypothetical protein [Izhakiella capsodis]
MQFLRDGDAFTRGGSATPDDCDNVRKSTDAEALF